MIIPLSEARAICRKCVIIAGEVLKEQRYMENSDAITRLAAPMIAYYLNSGVLPDLIEETTNNSEVASCDSCSG